MAYILIEAEPGKVKDLVPEIAATGGVESACGITGPYDVIAYVETRDVESLGDLVTKKIQALAGVRKTVTCLVTVCCPKRKT